MSNWYDEALKNAKKIDKASSDAVKKDLQAKAREQKTKKKAEKRAKLEEAKKNRGRKKLTPEINAKKDFEAIKKSVMGSSYVAPDGSKPKTIQGTAIYQKGSKQEAREKLKASGKKVTPTTDNKVFENIANEKGVAGTFGRVYTGVGSGFVDSFTAFPSTVASKVTGKDVDVREKMGLNMPENNPLEDSTAYQVGEMGGELLGYSVQNRAFAPLVNSALRGTKLGKMAGETFKQRAAQDLARNAIEAGSIGLAQNIGIAKQQGLEGSEFVKDVALNTGLDLVAGSALDIVPDAVKTAKNALKNTKLAKQAKNVGEVVDTTKKVADTGDLGAKTTIKTNAPRKAQLKNASQKASFTKDLNKEFERAYNEDHQKLADYIREYKGKDSTTHIVPINEDATGRGLRYTVSNNDDWYRKALKKYGSNNAVNKNADEIAADILNEELRLKRGQQEYASEYLYDLGELKQRNQLETPTGKVKANGVPIKHKKVGGFDVESSNIGAVNPDILFVGDKIENAKGLFDKLYKYTVSGQKELERMSKVAGNTKVDDYTQAVRAAKGVVSNIFHSSLVDSAGKVINEKSYKSLIDEIPKNVRKDFQTYAEHLHNIDRVREGVPVYKQYSAEDSQKIVDEMLKKHPEFAQYTKDLNEWWNQFTKAWLLDTGRISKESYEAMLKKYPNYIPTYRVEKGFGGIGSLPNRVNVGSGVKGAKGGESEIIPLEDSFLAQIDRIVSGTRKNDLYTSVIEEIRKNPEQMKSFGVLTENKDILKNDSLDDFLSEIDSRGLQEVKKGVGMVTAYIDGKPVSAYVNQDVLDALNLLNDAYATKAGSRLIGEIGRKVTNPVKAGITGYNPLFAISNMIRDFPTLYIQSQHSMLKTTTGIGKAIKEIATNGELYKQYKALGGKQSGYYATGKGFEEALGAKGIKAIKGRVEEILSIIGEGGETIPRFAEFINSMEKYGDTKDAALKALKDAGEVTVNFSRSAPVTKTLDGWTLYLNAAVQGLDKFGRTIKNAPLKTLGRSAAMISVPYAALMIANWDNPHYQDLNERTKQNYFCIPNYGGEKDADGNPMTFIKLPVNREYGAILGSSLDVMYGLMNGQSWEEATRGFKETVDNNFAPPNPLNDNILAPLLINLPQNKDFAGRAIVPESLVNVSPKNQQDYTTSGIAKGISNVANFLGDKGLPMSDTLKSPKKVDYLIDQYGGYYGQVAQAATGGDVDDVTSLGQNVAVEPFKQRFTADARFSSGPIADFYDAKEKALVEKNDAKLEGKEASEGQIKTKVYNKIASEISDLTKEEKQIQSSNLPKDEKDKKVKALRTKKNELAKSAETEVKKALKEYKQAPTFANLPTKTKERYDSKAGISKEKWAEAYESQKSEDRYSAKTLAMINNGVTTYEQAKSIFNGISESAFNEGMALHKAGVKIDAVKSAYVKANTNGNSYISKDEAIAYLNSTNYSRAQKRAIFDALMQNPNTKNPY